MNLLKPLTLALALIGAPVTVYAAARPAANITAAVASSARGADNVKLDESRKPAQVLVLPRAALRDARPRSLRRQCLLG
jgi:hypothetical protein